MKLSEWFKARSGQELMMIAVVAMLLVMIATRWAYISRTAKEAIRQRFVPPAEQADSLHGEIRKGSCRSNFPFSCPERRRNLPRHAPGDCFLPDSRYRFGTYTSPENPMKAMARIPAVISAMGTPLKALGTSSKSRRSRIPAKSTSARAKPSAVATE